METIEVSRKNHVVTVTLNRPNRRNAISSAMWREVAEVFTELKQNRDARVVVLTGAGGDFSSGGDLTGGSDRTREQMMQQITDMTLAIARVPMPTIAKVRGYAIGAGCSAAMACDLMLISDNAKLAQNFALRGMNFDTGGSYFLPRRIPMHFAKEMGFLAETIDAAAAERMGLVNRVVPDSELDSVVDEWAEKIASMPPIPLQNNKRLLNNSLHTSLEQMLEDEAAGQYACWSTEDFVEAMRAFREKRQPKFEGR